MTGEVEGPALHVAKGHNYAIEVSLATPMGWATAVLPLSTAREMHEYLGRCVGEQEAAMESDLRKVADEG